MHVTYTTRVQESVEIRGGIGYVCNSTVVKCHGNSGNQTLILYKSNKCSQTWNHCSSPSEFRYSPPLTQEAYKSLVKLCLGFVANFREDEIQFLWHKRRWGEKRGKGGQKDSVISRTFQCLSFQTMLHAETPHPGVSQHFSTTHIWRWWYKIRLRASISIHHLNEPKDMALLLLLSSSH